MQLCEYAAHELGVRAIIRYAASKSTCPVCTQSLSLPYSYSDIPIPLKPDFDPLPEEVLSVIMRHFNRSTCSMPNDEAKAKSLTAHQLILLRILDTMAHIYVSDPSLYTNSPPPLGDKSLIYSNIIWFPHSFAPIFKRFWKTSLAVPPPVWPNDPNFRPAHTPDSVKFRLVPCTWPECKPAATAVVVPVTSNPPPFLDSHITLRRYAEAMHAFNTAKYTLSQSMYTKLNHIIDNLEGFVSKAIVATTEDDCLISLTNKYSSEWKKLRKALSLP